MFKKTNDERRESRGAQPPLRNVYGIALERCCLCGCVTEVPRAEVVARRSCYVSGAGQLCEGCYAKVCGAGWTSAALARA